MAITTLSKRDVDSIFTRDYIPLIKEVESKQAGRKDKPLRRQEYNDMLDMLCRSGEIDEIQAATYCIPKRLVL